MMPCVSVLPRQGPRRQFPEQVAVSGRKATELKDVPSMGRAGNRTSGLCFRDKLVTYSV
jgi:hypothetical protein